MAGLALSVHFPWNSGKAGASADTDCFFAERVTGAIYIVL